MPAAALAAVATVGASAIGARSNSRAVDRASQDARYAADQNAQILRDQQAQLTGMVSPLLPAAYSGTNELMRLLRLGGSAGGTAPRTAANSNVLAGAQPAYGTPSKQGTVVDRGIDPGLMTPSARPTGSPEPNAPFGQATGTGSMDWASYLAQNPDVAAAAAADPVGYGDVNGDGSIDNTDFAEGHYGRYGRDEGRAAPASTPGEEPQDPTTYGPEAGGRPTFTRPDQPAAPSFGPPPSEASYFSNFQASPDYANRFNEAIRGVTDSQFAKGLGRSGATLKALQDRAATMASAEYGNWFSRRGQLYSNALSQYNTNRSTELGQFNADRTNQNTNFDLDRGYGTGTFETDRTYGDNRYDQRVGDLFRLTGIGTSGINALAGANGNYANGMVANNNVLATNTGNAALAGAANTNNFMGNVLGSMATYAGARTPAPSASVATPTTNVFANAGKTPPIRGTPYPGGPY